MRKGVALLKYTGAVIVFMVTYLISANIMQLVVQLANFGAQGVIFYILPYFAAVVAVVIGVYVGLTVVERLFPTVRPRRVVWVFIGLMCFLWGFIFLGLLVGTELLNETPPQAVQALVSVIAAWKLTAGDAEFGSDIHQ